MSEPGLGMRLIHKQQPLHEDTVQYEVTAAQLKHRASRIQIQAERPDLSWRQITALLDRLRTEGPEPVWDELVLDKGNPLSGNTTINRRLRAYAGAHRSLAQLREDLSNA